MQSFLLEAEVYLGAHDRDCLAEADVVDAITQGFADRIGPGCYAEDVLGLSPYFDTL